MSFVDICIVAVIIWVITNSVETDKLYNHYGLITQFK